MSSFFILTVDEDEKGQVIETFDEALFEFMRVMMNDGDGGGVTLRWSP